MSKRPANSTNNNNEAKKKCSFSIDSILNPFSIENLLRNSIPAQQQQQSIASQQVQHGNGRLRNNPSPQPSSSRVIRQPSSQLLSIPPSPQKLPSVQSSTNPLDFVKKSGTTETHNNHFNYREYSTEFEFETLERIADPQECFRLLIDKCLKDALKASASKGLVANQVALRVTSAVLDPAIEIPFNKLNKNTSWAVLNCFKSINQSKRETTIFGAPFTVQITCVNTLDISQNSRTVGGKGFEVSF